MTVFTVTPAPAPKFTYLLIIGGVIGLLGLGMFPGPGIFFLAMAAFCFWYGWFRDMRPKDHRAARTFRVTPSSAQGAGVTESRERPPRARPFFRAPRPA